MTYGSEGVKSDWKQGRHNHDHDHDHEEGGLVCDVNTYYRRGVLRQLDHDQMPGLSGMIDLGYGDRAADYGAVLDRAAVTVLDARKVISASLPAVPRPQVRTR